MVGGAGSGAPPLAFEVQQVVVNGGCHQFRQSCRIHILFVSVNNNNNNILHKNPKLKKLQDSPNSTYGIISVQNITKIAHK